MPKETKRRTYFNEERKHDYVEDFVVSYLNHKVWIRNEPLFVIDWSPLEIPLVKACVIVIGNQAYNMGKPFNSWVKTKGIRIERGVGGDNSIGVELESRGIHNTGTTPPSIEYLDEILSRATPADDMRSKIDELVLKYSDADKISDGQKADVEKELYSRIIRCMVNQRLIGDFQLKPLVDQRIENLEKRISSLESRINNHDRTLNDIQQRGGISR